MWHNIICYKCNTCNACKGTSLYSLQDIYIQRISRVTQSLQYIQPQSHTGPFKAKVSNCKLEMTCLAWYLKGQKQNQTLLFREENPSWMGMWYYHQRRKKETKSANLVKNRGRKSDKKQSVKPKHGTPFRNRLKNYKLKFSSKWWGVITQEAEVWGPTLPPPVCGAVRTVPPPNHFHTESYLVPLRKVPLARLENTKMCKTTPVLM